MRTKSQTQNPGPEVGPIVRQAPGQQEPGTIQGSTSEGISRGALVELASQFEFLFQAALCSWIALSCVRGCYLVVATV